MDILKSLLVVAVMTQRVTIMCYIMQSRTGSSRPKAHFVLFKR